MERKETALEAIERKRAERKEQARLEHEAQLAKDLEAIDALEAARGDSSVGVVRLSGGTAGCVSAVAVRCPTPPEMKRYHSRIKPTRDGRNREVPGDYQAAAEEIADSCLIYPDPEGFARLCDLRPGLKAQAGAQAVGLALGKAEEEGKG